MVSAAHIAKSRKGALRRYALYGNPGTPEGRSKGGKKSSAFFKKHPEIAKACGFVVRKEIRRPPRSAELSEFIGIMLGDGCLPGKHQLTVAFHAKDDKEHVEYMARLIENLFAVEHHIHWRKNTNGAEMVINGTNLIDYLLEQGLEKGNKVKYQVGVPEWICENPEYRVACLRGLIDTDGGVYRHKYFVNGKAYEYRKLAFANYSRPLLFFVYSSLLVLGYRARIQGNHVFLYSAPEKRKYFKEVGTHTPKNLKKLEEHLAA